jgi:Uncharacterized protein conserved in bacteria (DUF2252)
LRSGEAFQPGRVSNVAVVEFGGRGAVALESVRFGKSMSSIGGGRGSPRLGGGLRGGGRLVRRTPAGEQDRNESNLGDVAAASRANHGQRVVLGQRLMQSVSDIFLGWVRAEETLDGTPRDFYFRQLWDWKASVDLDAILPRGLELYAEVCGFLLARAHARSGDRIAIASYLGKGDTFDQALLEFATAYADQNERDHAALRAAADEGRIAVEEE